MAKKVILGAVDLSDVPYEYQWYTLVTQFNYEEKVLENIKDALSSMNLQKYVTDCFVPIKYKKETVTLANGTTKEKIKKLKGSFSNYIFLKCILTDAMWNTLRTTTGIAVIPTVGGIPVAVTEQEINNIKRLQAPEGFSNKELEELKQKEDKTLRFFRKGKEINSIV